MNSKSMDSRDSTKPAKVTRDPMAVLLSARAVSAALSMELPKREAADWVAVP